MNTEYLCSRHCGIGSVFYYFYYFYYLCINFTRYRGNSSWELSSQTFPAKIILATIQVHRASARLTSGTKSQELVIPRHNRTSSSRHGFRGFPRHDSSRGAREIDLTTALHRADASRFAPAFSTKRNHSLESGKKVRKAARLVETWPFLPPPLRALHFDHLPRLPSSSLPSPMRALAIPSFPFFPLLIADNL